MPGSFVELYDIALARDPGNARMLSRRLDVPVLRRWAAMGLLMLADSTGDANGLLAGAVAARLAVEGDATVRVVLAEALACLDPRRLRYRVGSLSADGEDDDLSQAIEYFDLRVSGRYEPSVAAGPWAAFFAENRVKG